MNDLVIEKKHTLDVISNEITPAVPKVQDFDVVLLFSREFSNDGQNDFATVVWPRQIGNRRSRKSKLTLLGFCYSVHSHGKLSSRRRLELHIRA